jgi:hypothetical protein
MMACPVNPHGGRSCGHFRLAGLQDRRRPPQRIDVAPVRADHLEPARRRINDGGLGALPRRAGSPEPPREPNFANPAPHGAREVAGQQTRASPDLVEVHRNQRYGEPVGAPLEGSRKRQQVSGAADRTLREDAYDVALSQLIARAFHRP